MPINLMIEPLTGGGFIVDLKILSKEQLEVLEQLKKLLLSNSTFYLAGSAFSESVALKALTYFNDAEEEELSEGIRFQFSWDEIKRDFIKLSYEYFTQQIKKT